MHSTFRARANIYTKRLTSVLQTTLNWDEVEQLMSLLYSAWQESHQIFICGNGGSAANANHLANDLLYGVSHKSHGLRVEALTANSSVLTCLANDLDYSQIFSKQLSTKARSGDLLIVLSGSGNSPNVVRALEVGQAIGMKTVAIVGYDGGKCKKLADLAIHFEIADMQIAEDLQLIVGHICMQSLKSNASSE